MVCVRLKKPSYSFQRLETSSNLQNAEVCSKVASTEGAVGRHWQKSVRRTVACLNHSETQMDCIRFRRGWSRVLECSEVFQFQKTAETAFLDPTHHISVIPIPRVYQQASVNVGWEVKLPPSLPHENDGNKPIDIY